MATVSTAKKESLSRRQAAAKISKIIEEHMTIMGLSEEEKDRRTEKAAATIDKAVSKHNERLRAAGGRAKNSDTSIASHHNGRKNGARKKKLLMSA